MEVRSPGVEATVCEHSKDTMILAGYDSMSSTPELLRVTEGSRVQGQLGLLSET